MSSSAGLPTKIGSVGKALDGLDVRLVDDSGDDYLYPASHFRVV